MSAAVPIEGAAGVSTVLSSSSFEETIQRLLSVLADRGLRVFDIIDHQDAAATAGLTLRPTRVVIFGSPTAGTPLMVVHPLIALELPLRILVWQGDDGRVRLSSIDADALASQFGITGASLEPLRAPAALAALAATAEGLGGDPTTSASGQGE